MGTVKYSGPIASFHCPTEATIRSLKVYFSPKQAGEGDPSPDNVRAISGWDGIDVTQCGVNIFDRNNFIQKSYYFNSTIISGDSRSKTAIISCTPNTTYTIYKPPTIKVDRFAVGCSDHICEVEEELTKVTQDLANVPNVGWTSVNHKIIFTTDSTAKYLYIRYRNGFTPSESGYATDNEMLEYILGGMQVEVGENEKSYDEYEYKPYVGSTQTVDWPNIGTIYGGYVDLITGELVEMWGNVDLGTINTWYVQTYENTKWFRATLPNEVWQNTWSPNVTSSLNNHPPHFLIDRFKIVSGSSIYYGTSGDNVLGMDWLATIRIKCDSYNDDIDAFKAAMNGVILYYEYATPIIHQLTPQQLQTFIGQNNIWSNADYVEVEYDLHETQSILARKQFIIANQPHVEKLAAAPLQSFKTDTAAPVKECKVHFEPKQDLNGYSKPWISGTGKNLVNVSVNNKLGNANFMSHITVTKTGFDLDNTTVDGGYLVAVKPNTTYTYSYTSTYNGNSMHGRVYKISDPTKFNYTLIVNETRWKGSYTFTTDEDTNWIVVGAYAYGDGLNSSLTNMQLEEGSVATSYEPYENICPIEGWNGIITGKASKNLLDVTLNDRSSYTATNGTVSTKYVGSGNGTRVWFSQIFSAGTYTISCDYSGEGTNGPRLLCSQFISNSTWNNSYQGYWKNFSGRSCTFTTEKPFSVGLVFISRAEHNGEPGVFYNIQLELGSTATEYEPYNGETIPIIFPATKNLFNEQWEQGNIEVGNNAGSSTCMRTGFIDVNSSTSYYLYTPRENNVFVFEYLEDGTYANKVNSVHTSHTFTTGSTTKKIRIVDRNSGTETVNTGINYPAAITYYEPYGTIYGGYVDLVTGEVVQEQIAKTFTILDSNQTTEYTNTTLYRFSFNVPLYGQGNATKGITMCDVASYSYTNNDMVHWYTTTNNANGHVYVWLPKTFNNTDTITIVATLYTPQIIATLTPTQLKTLRGTNNIWSNANGTIELSYWKH